MRRIHCSQAEDTIAVMLGQPPPDRCAPVVSNHSERSPTELIGQAGNVSGEEIEMIAVHALGLIAEIVATKIWRDHVKTLFGNVSDLVPPAIPELRKSVQQKYE